MSEIKIQAELYQWFYNKYPEFRILGLKTPRCLLIHNFLNPRSSIEGVMLQGAGLTKGFPDLTLFVPSGGYAGLHIELKIKGEKARKEQIEVHEALIKQGYAVVTVDNLEDGQNAIIKYLECI